MTEDFASTKQKNGEKHVVLTDAKSGKGVNRVKEVALLVSEEVNAKRAAKGLMPRPVRTAIIGYPNVGKSALINRLTNSKACASAPRPGVTRNLRWVRVGGDLDLLDSPGVLPPRLADPAVEEDEAGRDTGNHRRRICVPSGSRFPFFAVQVVLNRLIMI